MLPLERRIIDLSYKHKLSHIGSCITAVHIIDEIFAEKGDGIFVLSNGHAGLALYVVMEKYGLGDADALLTKHGIHPNTDAHIFCSTGSLGHGIGIAVGAAMSDRSRKVYCLISDGECAEGSVWEALRIAAEQHLDNLIVHLNANGYGANAQRRLWDLVEVDHDVWRQGSGYWLIQIGEKVRSVQPVISVISHVVKILISHSVPRDQHVWLKLF